MSQFREKSKQWQYLLILLLMLGMLFGACPAYCTDYFVATDGNDNNDGSIDHPFKTIYPKAVGVVVAGDTIYVREGTYTYSGSGPAITLPSKSEANETKRCYLMGYNGERPLLDCTAMTSSDCIKINGSYWYIKGMDLKGAPRHGININGNGIIGAAGSYNIVEFCSSYENRNTGVKLDNGASYNKIINCDSYYNYDYLSDPPGKDADGFAPKMEVGTGNYFYGCRSWQNSDDAYDGYLDGADDVNTTYENCWAFKAGYLKDGNVCPGGNGNGFKMGSSSLRHNVILKNCLCFNNTAKGFDQNHNQGSMTLYNCTSFSNGGNNYSIYEALADGKTATVTNCVSHTGGRNLGSFVVGDTNSWNPPFVVTNADFASIDPSAAYGPRKADGSLPGISFMRLASTSDLIDGGTDVNLPFEGDAPDLGAFEHIDGDCQTDGIVDLADSARLASNWRNDNCGDCNGADFDGNGTVDWYDFAVIAENWLKH